MNNDELDTDRGVLPGPYDREAGLKRIAAAEKRKQQRVQRNKTTNRRRNKAARQQRRHGRRDR